MVLTWEQLVEGYAKAVNNGFRLLEASLTLLAQFPEVSLGLAEIGQEEIGKSLSLLAAFSLPNDSSAWISFWRGWKNHQLKGHRAFLYELVSPTRLELLTRDGITYKGAPTRPKVSDEKEMSFYVNFDPKSCCFVSPDTTVDKHESYNRIMALLYLAVTAFSVQTALDQSDRMFRYPAFSEVAFRICSEKLYQQDMPSIFEEFEQRSERHEALMRSLRERLADGKDYLFELLKRSSASGEPR